MSDTGPRIDDDAETVPVDGVASHPDRGKWVIPGMGAAAFWIDFELGKWLYPKLRDGKIDVMDESVLKNAREAFGCEFIQSCYLL